MTPPLLPAVPFGASYYPPHYDPAEWAGDLDRMVAAGLTMIRTAELLASWDRIEVAEHVYDFSWLDTLFDLVEERGMSVLLGTGSCCPPIWMIDRWDDLQIVSRDGIPYPTATVWSWACKEHPGYRAELARWIGVLADRYGGRPGLAGWQVDNEPGYPCIPWRGGRIDLYCYCANTEAAFRDWLAARYPSLDALSDAWAWDPTNHRYSAWTQVRAPRAMPSEWGGVTAWLDWRRFLAEQLSDFVGWQHDLLKAATPHLPTCTNVFIWSRHDPFGVRMAQDPWRLATRVDAIGFDLYPGITKRFLRQPEYVAMYLDYARSAAAAAGVELWLTEAESGPLSGWILGPDHATTTDDVVRLNADTLGAGGRMVLYQGWREPPCIPIHWGGLVDLRGTPTPRCDAAAAVSGAVASEADLFLRAVPSEPEVVLVVDYENAVCAEGMAAGDALLECIAGAYRAFGGAGFEVGFCSGAEIAGSRAKLLVLPLLMVVPDEVGAALAEYVAAGGHVLSFAKVAMLTGQGWYHPVRPGAGLDRLLGVTETEIDTVDGRLELEVAAHDLVPDFPGGTVVGAHHHQVLDVTGDAVTVVGRFGDGSPALTARPHGRGLAWACATHLDMAVSRYGDPATVGLLAAIARRAGARPLLVAAPAADGLPRVWARRAVHGDQVLVTVTSTDDVPRTVNVAVGGTTARDLLSGELLPAAAAGIDLVVPPRGSRLVVVSRA